MLSDILSRVEVPKPGVPDSGDVVDGGNKVGNWLTDMSPTTMKVLVIGIIAALVAGALRKSPFLKGAVVATVIVGIIAVAFI